MKKSPGSNLCKRIQRQIILGDELPEEQQHAVAEHLHRCRTCSAFTAFQGGLKDTMTKDRESWRPRKSTLNQLEQHLSNRGKKKRPYFPYWLEKLLRYRVPVYQLLGTALLVVCIYWGASQRHSTMAYKASWPDTCRIDASVIQTDQASGILQAMSEQKIGRPISEDSLFSRLAFTM
jgi:hypothetical protein